jgi:hypothetical protein
MTKTAVINGVTLTKEQLEDGLRQIEQAAAYVPQPGHFFTFTNADGLSRSVYLALRRNTWLLSSAALEEGRVTAVTVDGDVSWFRTPATNCTYTRVVSFSDRTEVR